MATTFVQRAMILTATTMKVNEIIVADRLGHKSYFISFKMAEQKYQNKKALNEEI
jgi:hypothetical protein